MRHLHRDAPQQCYMDAGGQRGPLTASSQSHSLAPLNRGKLLAVGKLAHLAAFPVACPSNSNSQPKLRICTLAQASHLTHHRCLLPPTRPANCLFPKPQVRSSLHTGSRKTHFLSLARLCRLAGAGMKINCPTLLQSHYEWCGHFVVATVLSSLKHQLKYHICLLKRRNFDT